uniref:Uncharacterized protein n=1 Tax=Glossina austeni TaxID=7395 RepID=A0A1A9UTW8_GLOAU
MKQKLLEQCLLFIFLSEPLSSKQQSWSKFLFYSKDTSVADSNALAFLLRLTKSLCQTRQCYKGCRNATKNLADFQLSNSEPILLFSSADNFAVAKAKSAQA